MMHPSENPQELLFREEQAFHRNQKTADDAPGMAGSPETDGCVYRGNATAPDLRRPSNGLLHKSKRCMARAMAALPDSAPGFGEGVLQKAISAARPFCKQIKRKTAT